VYIPEKRLIEKVGDEMKKRLPFLTGWKIGRADKPNDRLAGLLVSARSGGKTYRFCVEVKTAGYPQYVRDAAAGLKKYVAANPQYYPVVVVPFISANGKKICDEHHVGYMDFGGNMKIAHGSIFVSTEGKDRPKEEVPASRSIFSLKSARITRLFLSHPRSVWTQKDLAGKTMLSKGMVSRVVKRMVAAGYAMEKDGKLSLANFDDLLSAWTESEVRRRENKRNYYVWAQNPAKLMKAVAAGLSAAKVEYAFTQEAGALLVAPFATFDIVSLYIKSLDKFPEKPLSASRVDKGFNLTVIEAPDDYILINARDKGGLKVADDLQLYADLMKNPLRGEKQAGHILALMKKTLR